MTARWLDRTLFKGPYLTVVIDQKSFDGVMKRLEQPSGVPFCNEGGDATTHTYLNKDKQLCCIVGIRPTEDVDGIEVAALLVHEAVHIWQQVRSQIVAGYIDPSRVSGLEAEMEAYAIQNISAELMLEYARLRGHL